MKSSKYLLIKRSLAFDKAKKDMGDMKGVVKSVETHNDRLLVTTESGEKLELKVNISSYLLQVFVMTYKIYLNFRFPTRTCTNG